MQVAAAYSLPDSQPQGRVGPIFITIAIHVLIVYGVAVGTGFVPNVLTESRTQVVDVPREIDPPKAKDPAEEPNLSPTIIPRDFDPGPIDIQYDPITLPPGEVKSIGSNGISIDIDAPVAPTVSPVRLLRSFEPTYPSASIRGQESGVVYVLVTITPFGTVGDARVQTSSGFPRLDEAALKAVRDWRFAPATRGSQAISAAVTVPVRFELKLR